MNHHTKLHEKVCTWLDKGKQYWDLMTKKEEAYQKKLDKRREKIKKGRKPSKRRNKGKGKLED